MECKLELPYPEDIYDMDSASLRELENRLRGTDLSKLSEKQAFKTNNLLEIVTMELEERALAGDFEKQCEILLSDCDSITKEIDDLIGGTYENLLLGQTTFQADEHLYANLSVKKEPTVTTATDHTPTQSHHQVNPPCYQSRKPHLPPVNPSLLNTPTEADSNISRLTQESSKNKSTITANTVGGLRHNTMKEKLDPVPDWARPPSQQPKMLSKTSNKKYRTQKKVTQGGWLDFVKNTLSHTKVEQGPGLLVGAGYKNTGNEGPIYDSNGHKLVGGLHAAPSHPQNQIVFHKNAVSSGGHKRPKIQARSPKPTYLASRGTEEARAEHKVLRQSQSLQPLNENAFTVKTTKNQVNLGRNKLQNHQLDKIESFKKEPKAKTSLRESGNANSGQKTKEKNLKPSSSEYMSKKTLNSESRPTFTSKRKSTAELTSKRMAQNKKPPRKEQERMKIDEKVCIEPFEDFLGVSKPIKPESFWLTVTSAPPLMLERREYLETFEKLFPVKKPKSMQRAQSTFHQTKSLPGPRIKSTTVLAPSEKLSKKSSEDTCPVSHQKGNRPQKGLKTKTQGKDKTAKEEILEKSPELVKEIENEGNNQKEDNKKERKVENRKEPKRESRRESAKENQKEDSVSQGGISRVGSKRGGRDRVPSMMHPRPLSAIPLDYSPMFSCWQALFSLYYTEGPRMDLVATMRDILQAFSRHSQMMERLEKMQTAPQFGAVAGWMAPPERGRQERLYLEEPSRLMGFVGRTCIPWERYRERQEIYLQGEERLREFGQGTEVVESETEPRKQFFRVVKSKTEVGGTAYLGL